jgi:peptide-methionine (S)-S-oxide reductase
MSEHRKEIATLAGGCYWCLEAAFEQLRGVEKVQSGFAGGDPRRTSYEDVCSGATGHAEVVQATFDPDVIPYRTLLEVFFTLHDPTTLNRQGADVGTQYRSAIFYHSAEQHDAARAMIATLEREGIWNDHIVTEVVPFERFHPADAYHDAYYRRNPNQPYCRAVIAPKLAKLRKRWADWLRPETAGHAS